MSFHDRVVVKEWARAVGEMVAGCTTPLGNMAPWFADGDGGIQEFRQRMSEWARSKYSWTIIAQKWQSSIMPLK